MSYGLAIGWVSMAHADVSLLSNNIKPGNHSEDFPEGRGVIATKMSLEWVEDGDFATDAETVKTSKLASNPKTVLFDGNTGSNWKSRTYSTWGGGKWATLNVDLGKEYALNEFNGWVLHEATRGTEGILVLLSDDGKTFTEQGTALVGDIEVADKLIVKISLKLEQPVKARYVQLRVERKKSAKQQQIAELAIWGTEVDDQVKYLDASRRPAVNFTAQNVQSGVALIDWGDKSNVTANVKNWKIYKSRKAFTSVLEDGVELVKSLDAKQTSAAVYPLQSGSTFHFGITAVYTEGESPGVKSERVDMPAPLECNTFGDMIAINHFRGGGARHVSHGANQEAYESVAVDLLGDLGVKQIRWWVVEPKTYDAYYKKGIGMFTYPHSNNIPNAKKLGVHCFAGPQNEPDLAKRPADLYVASLKAVFEKRFFGDFSASVLELNPVFRR